jgi:hypothetical protein
MNIHAGLRRSSSLLAAIVLAGCTRSAPPDPQCAEFVEKVLRCDPSAPATMRQDPARWCAQSRMECARIDTTVDAGCTRFVGCLYDGP